MKNVSLSGPSKTLRRRALHVCGALIIAAAALRLPQLEVALADTQVTRYTQLTSDGRSKEMWSLLTARGFIFQNNWADETRGG